MVITLRVKQAGLVLLAGMACISVTQGLNNAILRKNGSQDNQWGPSRALLEHTDPYAAYFDPDGSPFILAQAPNYPASGLMLMWPYAVWDWPTAKALWAFSNILFTVLIFACLFRLLPVDTPRTTKFLIASLFLCGTPWRNGLGNGQHALFTLSFFLLAVVLFPQNGHRASIPLAVSWFKYTIAFPLTLFFARSMRGLVIVLGAAAIHIALTLFASAWVGTSPYNLLLGPLEVAQSATGRGYLDVFAIASELGLSSKLVPAVVALFILGVTFFAVRRDDDTISCLSTLSLASMTVIFHADYDFVVLVLPLCYVLRDRVKSARAKYYLCVILMIWFVDKIVFVVSGQAWFAAFGGIASAYFWLKVLVYYGALFADWTTAFNSGSTVAKAGAVG